MSGVAVDPAWEYNAPQYVDFTAPIDQQLDDRWTDSYFDFDHENGKPVDVNSSQKEDEFFDASEPAQPTPQHPKSNSHASRQVSTPAGPSNKSKNQEVSLEGSPAVAHTSRNKQREEVTDSPARLTRSKSNLIVTDSNPQKATQAKKRRSQVVEASPVPKRHTRSNTADLRDLPENVSKEQDKNAETLQETVKEMKKETETDSSQHEIPDTQKNTSGAEKKEYSVPSNLCTSLSEWRAKTGQNKATTQANNNRKSPHISGTTSKKKAAAKKEEKTSKVSPGVKQRRSIPTPKLKQNSSTCRSSDTGPTTKTSSVERRSRSTGRPVSTATNTRSSRSQSRNEQRGRSVSSEKNTSLERKGTQPAVKPKLTIAMTPSFMKREMKPGGGGNVMSTEDMELEHIKELQRKLRQTRRMADESLKKTQASSCYVPVRSNIELTKPQEFHFKSDARIKTQAPGPKNGSKLGEFSKSLRCHPSSPVRPAHKGATVPKPFHLTDTKKRQPNDSECPTKFQSMAQQLAEFSSKTPERFRSRPKRKEPTPVKASKSGKLTVPHTPHFETKTRHRPVSVPSAADLEEKEVEELKKYKFKANPVNDKIMKNPMLGVKKVVPKEPTEAVGFDLETDYRIKSRQANKSQREEEYEFHAQPVPRGILDGPVGLKPTKERPLTHPESPAFALKNRKRPAPPPVNKDNEAKRVCANPVPHTGIPFQPKLDHHVTEPKPFSFDQRNQEMLAHKEQKIQQIIYEEKKVAESFRAQPVCLSPDILPPKRTKGVTQPEPFDLEVDLRGANKAEQWRKQVEEELKEQRARAHAFKAKPCTIPYQEPFVPKRSLRPLTDVSEFELNTERRAEQREEWEAYKHQKEQLSATQQADLERQQREAEQQEIEKMRAQMVHKPNPIRNYKSVEVKSSDKPLTQPHTPRFSERLRARSVRI